MSCVFVNYLYAWRCEKMLFHWSTFQIEYQFSFLNWQQRYVQVDYSECIQLCLHMNRLKCQKNVSFRIDTLKIIVYANHLFNLIDETQRNRCISDVHFSFFFHLSTEVTVISILSKTVWIIRKKLKQKNQFIVQAKKLLYIPFSISLKKNISFGHSIHILRKLENQIEICIHDGI